MPASRGAPRRGRHAGAGSAGPTLLAAATVAVALRVLGGQEAARPEAWSGSGARRTPAPLAGLRGSVDNTGRLQQARTARKFFDKIFGNPDDGARKKLKKLAVAADEEVSSIVASLKSSSNTLSRAQAKAKAGAAALEKSQVAALAAASFGWAEDEATWDARFDGLSGPVVALSEQLQASSSDVVALAKKLADSCEAAEKSGAARKAKADEVMKNLDAEVIANLKEDAAAALGNAKKLADVVAACQAEAKAAAGGASSAAVEKGPFVEALRKARAEMKEAEVAKVAKAKAAKKAAEDAKAKAAKDAAEEAAAAKSEEDGKNTAVLAAAVLAVAAGAFFLLGGSPSDVKSTAPTAAVKSTTVVSTSSTASTAAKSAASAST